MWLAEGRKLPPIFCRNEADPRKGGISLCFEPVVIHKVILLSFYCIRHCLLLRKVASLLETVQIHFRRSIAKILCWDPHKLMTGKRFVPVGILKPLNRCSSSIASLEHVCQLCAVIELFALFFMGLIRDYHTITTWE